MEIERKFLVPSLPCDLDSRPCHLIEQAYLCTSPVVRIRRQDDDFILTYKGSGMMAREEYNLPLTKKSYEHLLTKADGCIITKRRYIIPLDTENLKAELDIFEGHHAGLRIVEVEFESEEQANRFVPPSWFGEDVTFDGRYHNSYLSQV